MERSLFNPRLLDEWKKIDPSSGDQLIRDILEMFFAQSPGKFQKFLDARQKKDFHQLQLIAHSLKSDFGNVGAERVFDLLNEVEKFCLAKKTEQIEPICRLLETQIPATIRLIEVYKKEFRPQRSA